MNHYVLSSVLLLLSTLLLFTNAQESIPVIQGVNTDIELYPISAAARVNTRVQPCPSNTDVIGYDTILDMNIDIQAELNRIESGNIAQLSEYFFILCPQMFQDASIEGTVTESINGQDMTATRGTLEIKLPNTNIVCGMTGDSSDVCEFRGGSLQVEVIADTVESVHFRGITFNDFQGSSVHFNVPNRVIKAEFYDCIWEDMNGPSAITVDSPIRLDIHTATIRDGFGTSFFPNRVGSTFNLEDITVHNIQAENSFLRTAGSSSISNMVLADISDSRLTRVTNTDGGGQLTVSRFQVHEMLGLQYILFSSGAGTTNTLQDFSFYDNVETTEWNGVVSTDGATATVSEGTFLRNTQVNVAFGSRDDGIITVTDIEYDSNTGIPGQSSLVYTSGGTATGTNLNMTNNTLFIGHFFAIHGGHINIHNNCINSGRSDALGFVSRDSSYDMTYDNFIDDLVVSDVCHERNNQGYRLAYEERDSTVMTNCFTSEICETECLQFGSLETCRGEVRLTPPPTISPRPTEVQTRRPNPLGGLTAPTPFPQIPPTFRPTRLPAEVQDQIGTGNLIPTAEGGASDTGGGGGGGGDSSSASSSSLLLFSLWEQRKLAVFQYYLVLLLLPLVLL